MRTILRITFCFFLIIMIKKTDAQTEDPYYLRLYSGDTIFGKQIEFKHPFLSSPHFLVDEISYNIDVVRFYQNENGYFANTKYANTEAGRNLSQLLQQNFHTLETLEKPYSM